ncbi:hypothetical protein JCM8202v2_004097 [Rhodotorula sphaerocarpa]
MEVAGEVMTGTLRFAGVVEGKSGMWAGVELDDQFAGRGKNDGTVQGVQYFACPPQCGLFLPLQKVHPRKRLEVEDLRPSTSQPSPPRAGSVSPTKRLSASTTTPKPTRMARASIGGATPTPAAGRKSLGVAPGTAPRASLGGRASIGAPRGTPRLSSSAMKRPPSRQAAPEVPPIPLAYGLARSVTPSSAMGTPTAAPRRRASLATASLTSDPPRSATPSLRSSSRQSFASSVSRLSHRSSVLDRDPDEPGEAELRQLLDASERLGREMEDRLAEKNKRIQELEEKSQDDRHTRELEAKCRELVAQLDAERHSHEQQRLELTSGSTEKDAELDGLRKRLVDAEAQLPEIDVLRNRLDKAQGEHAQEAQELRAEIEKLRTAGQALCETYEEKIAEIELARLEAVDLVEALQAQLADKNSTQPVRTPSPVATRSDAAAIDAENTRAELEHLRAKVSTLEEQLEEARMHLEQEVSDARDRRAKTDEAEQALKEQIRNLKTALESAQADESRATARIRELQAALSEAHSTLEAERSELEGLRHDVQDDSDQDTLRQAQRDLAVARADLERSERDATQLGALVTELRRDLAQAKEEVSSLQASNPGSDRQAGDADQRAHVTSLKARIETLSAENDQLLSAQNELRTQVDSLTRRDGTSTNSGAQDELETLRRQLEEVQRKSETEIKALTLEITELESLVESKVYHEDELETELEALRAKVHGMKLTLAPDGGSGDVPTCEMCGGQGHTLDSCPDFGSASSARSSLKSPMSDEGLKVDDVPMTSPLMSVPMGGRSDSQQWCDDCEEFGHSLENCPLASEMF